MGNCYFLKKYNNDSDESWAVFKNLARELKGLTVINAEQAEPLVFGLDRDQALAEKNRLKLVARERVCPP